MVVKYKLTNIYKFKKRTILDGTHEGTLFTNQNEAQADILDASTDTNLNVGGQNKTYSVLPCRVIK